MLSELEQGMINFSRLISITLKLEDGVNDIPGTWATGGMGYALMAYCHATMKSSFELIAEMAKLDEMIESKNSWPDLIITGEGNFDSQSLQGKLMGRLSERANKYDIPLIVLCSGIRDDINMDDIGKNICVFSIYQSPINLDPSYLITLSQKKFWDLSSLYFPTKRFFKISWPTFDKLQSIKS